MKGTIALVAAAVLVCAAPTARAADYPTRPITLVIGFAPGGPSDVLARIIHGCVVAVTVGVVATGLAAIIGILLGTTAGFFGGTIDLILSRVVEVVMCFPTFFVIIAVISFLAAWNQYTWPRAVVTESRWETIQIGLKSLSASTVEQNNVGFAAAIIAALPVLALLIFLQRHLIRGLTAGAVKG